MPTDVSHLPPTPTWVHPAGPNDDRDPVVRWQAHLATGRLGANPPAPPHIVAQRDATAAQFAQYARDHRRLRREYGL